MGGRVTKMRLLGAFVAALEGLYVFEAQAVPPPPPSLEQQAETEFAQAGLAVRERLDREAAGDSIGTAIAAHEAELHRYHYLDLQRELHRQRPQPTAFRSVAAPRDPFTPDGSFLANSGALATRRVPGTTLDRDGLTRTPYPSWDMYRPRVSVEEGVESTASAPAARGTPGASAMGRAKDMYATDNGKPVPSEDRAATTGPEALISSADAPRQPFLVYREPSARPGARK
jgi:hypothetical protein